MKDRENFESWKNATESTLFIKKYNNAGELAAETVNSGRTFYLTPQERRINQEMAAEESLDFFKNGMLSPVRLLETEEDAKEIASNPNLMTDTDIAALFKASWKTFEGKVNEVSNATTLNRMVQVAGEVDATMRQVGAIKTRLDVVAPDRFTEVTSAPLSDRNTSMKPVTPK